jgi:hypothetical protein
MTFSRAILQEKVSLDFSESNKPLAAIFENTINSKNISLRRRKILAK